MATRQIIHTYPSTLEYFCHVEIVALYAVLNGDDVTSFKLHQMPRLLV